MLWIENGCKEIDAECFTAHAITATAHLRATAVFHKMASGRWLALDLTVRRDGEDVRDSAIREEAREFLVSFYG